MVLRARDIRAAFGEQEIGQRLDLVKGDGGADDRPALPGLGHKPGAGQDFDVMRQGRSRDAGAFAQRADAEAVMPRTHQCAQNRQTLFGPKRGKGGSGAGEIKGVMRIHFHISNFIEMFCRFKLYFEK